MSAYIGSELKGTNPTGIDINEYFSVTSIPANENIKITTVGTASRIQIPADNILSGQTIILTVKKTFPTNFIQILLGVLNTQPGGDNPNTCKIKIDDQVETYSYFAHPQIGAPLISNSTPIFLAPKTNIVITLLKDLNDGVSRLIGLTGYDNNGIAHNISEAYIGVYSEKTKDVPRQETTTTTKTISCTVNDVNTASQYKKLSDLFTITNGSDYYFANNNTESTNNYSTYKSNNGGHSNTTASTTLTALHDFSALSFGYSYSGESNYDYVTLTVGGTTVESKASGSTTNKTWNGTLSKGQTIKITFTKDNSYDRYDDCGTIYNIQATYQATVTETTTVIDKVGTGEYASLARNIKKIYLGDENNKAQLVFDNSISELVSEYTSSGTYTVVVPKWANYAIITACGGGGGGGSTRYAQPDSARGGGGGAAIVSDKVYNISAYRGQTISITIGAGGSAELDGGNTVIGSMLTLDGGAAGSNAGGNGGNGGGAGGAARTNGQNGLIGTGGVAGAIDSNGNSDFYGGGGGGGSLGYGGKGGNANAQDTGSSTSGFDGYRGGGGGGAGGTNSRAFMGAGGKGGDGYCKIIWKKNT